MRLDHLLSKRKSKGCFVIGLSSEELENQIFPVAMRSGETPVHIPNTMVKTCTAESTALETVWEVRWLPDLRAYSSAG